MSQFSCDSGQLLPVENFCDGSPQCADLSDEHCGIYIIDQYILYMIIYFIYFLCPFNKL